MSQNNISRRILWILCRGWLLLGVGTLAAGLGFGVDTSLFLYNSIAADGTIVDMSAIPNRYDDAIDYFPVFTFATEDGQAYTARSGVGTNPPAFETGQKVRVLYLKSNPDSVKLDTFWQLWFVTVMCAGLGALFTGTGYLLLRYERRRNRRESSISPVFVAPQP